MDELSVILFLTGCLFGGFGGFVMACIGPAAGRHRR